MKLQKAEADEESKKQMGQPDPQGADGQESHQKKNARAEASEVEKDSKSTMSSDMHRGKQLPVGMKVKKRISDEESLKENGVQNGAERVKAKSRESNSRTEEDASITVSNVEPVHRDEESQASQNPPKDKNQTTGLPMKKSLSKSLPKCGSQAQEKDSENTEDQTSECLSQPTEANRAKDHQEDTDDDEVVLVSVKPAEVKSPPVSAVQKTLTAFPGFQPASKVKSQQEDPRGLRNLLTSQLKQKKVSDFFSYSVDPNSFSGSHVKSTLRS